MSDKLRAAFERDVCGPQQMSKLRETHDHLAVVEYLDPHVERAWLAFQAGHAHAMRGGPVAWMTRESAARLKDGGNCRGAVPVHQKRSTIATIPVYVRQEEE